MFIVFFLAVLFFIELMLRRYLVSSGLFLREFPSIDDSIIKKYKTFDRQLGWKPIPTVQHPDNTGSYIGINRGATYSIDNSGGRTFQNSFEKEYITSFGDSFCMCREVNDNETIQYFLSKLTNSFVSNYGVGNYGLDQAVLRFENTQLPATVKHVLMIVTPWTVERIISVWKHYCEPGNVLAAKPRFILESDKLKLVDNFIKDPKDLLKIKYYKEFLHKNDDNFQYFYQNLVQLPKTALGYLFSNKELVNYLLAFNKLRSSKDKNIKDFLKNAEPFLIKKFQKENEYLQILYSKHTCLLKLILLRFSKLCATKGYIPHLIMLPSFSHIKFMQAGNSLYKNVLPAICTEINLNYIDMFKFWDLPNCDDLEKYFVDVYGHCSALGNQKVANIIYKEILS